MSLLNRKPPKLSKEDSDRFINRAKENERRLAEKNRRLKEEYINMTNKMDEQIIVVPRKALFANEELLFEGTESRAIRVAKLNENIQKNLGVMRRGDAEENKAFKQPIPYAVIKRGDEVFLYERLEGGGEAGLHGKLSIGAGGHMNLDGHNFEESLMNNLNRELEEELDIQSSKKELKVVGFINSEATPVDQVHIGVLVVLYLDKNATVTVRETDQLKGSFVDLVALKQTEVYDRLENWSKIAVDTLLY
jgi:predicted NUDIX family phosphoesterase